jgi:hypothetical protein
VQGAWLTPKGIDQKAKLTLRFLDRKRVEYEALKKEIAQLRKEVSEAEQGMPAFDRGSYRYLQERLVSRRVH